VDSLNSATMRSEAARASLLEAQTKTETKARELEAQLATANCALEERERRLQASEKAAVDAERARRERLAEEVESCRREQALCDAQLSLRFEKLTEREGDLKQREAHLKESMYAHERAQLHLSVREAELSKQEEGLCDRETQLASRELNAASNASEKLVLQNENMHLAAELAQARQSGIIAEEARVAAAAASARAQVQLMAMQLQQQQLPQLHQQLKARESEQQQMESQRQQLQQQLKARESEQQQMESQRQQLQQQLKAREQYHAGVAEALRTAVNHSDEARAKAERHMQLSRADELRAQTARSEAEARLIAAETRLQQTEAAKQQAEARALAAEQALRAPPPPDESLAQALRQLELLNQEHEALGNRHMQLREDTSQLGAQHEAHRKRLRDELDAVLKDRAELQSRFDSLLLDREEAIRLQAVREQELSSHYEARAHALGVQHATLSEGWSQQLELLRAKMAGEYAQRSAELSRLCDARVEEQSRRAEQACAERDAARRSLEEMKVRAQSQVDLLSRLTAREESVRVLANGLGELEARARLAVYTQSARENQSFALESAFSASAKARENAHEKSNPHSSSGLGLWSSRAHPQAEAFERKAAIRVDNSHHPNIPLDLTSRAASNVNRGPPLSSSDLSAVLSPAKSEPSRLAAHYRDDPVNGAGGRAHGRHTASSPASSGNGEHPELEPEKQTRLSRADSLVLLEDALDSREKAVHAREIQCTQREEKWTWLLDAHAKTHTALLTLEAAARERHLAAERDSATLAAALAETAALQRQLANQRAASAGLEERLRAAEQYAKKTAEEAELQVKQLKFVAEEARAGLDAAERETARLAALAAEEKRAWEAELQDAKQAAQSAFSFAEGQQAALANAEAAHRSAQTAWLDLTEEHNTLQREHESMLLSKAGKEREARLEVDRAERVQREMSASVLRKELETKAAQLKVYSEALKQRECTLQAREDDCVANELRVKALLASYLARAKAVEAELARSRQFSPMPLTSADSSKVFSPQRVPFADSPASVPTNPSKYSPDRSNGISKMGQSPIIADALARERLPVSPVPLAATPITTAAATSSPARELTQTRIALSSSPTANKRTRASPSPGLSNSLGRASTVDVFQNYNSLVAERDAPFGRFSRSARDGHRVMHEPETFTVADIDTRREDVISTQALLHRPDQGSPTPQLPTHAQQMVTHRSSSDVTIVGHARAERIASPFSSETSLLAQSWRSGQLSKTLVGAGDRGPAAPSRDDFADDD
jgi:hypothetical protein